ncbi:MAG: VOC family protein [Actinobacteria bacterium]|nr:MAG: VOC family protein [Actinomycetota bacterium]
MRTDRPAGSVQPAPVQIVQVAAVVRDLRNAVENYHRALGWGPWSAYVCKPPRHHHTMLRGEPVEFSMQLAETMVGSIAFELIEPLDGPSIYKEWLEEHGEGLHHVACLRVDGLAEETLAQLERQGLHVLMSGVIDDCAYHYLDSEPLLKVVVESLTGDQDLLAPDWTYPVPRGR